MGSFRGKGRNEKRDPRRGTKGQRQGFLKIESLEERLLRFEDAIASYTRLYQLTYNDAEWLDDMIYRYDPSLNLEMPGECSLSVQLVR